jgi:hypothetical protein
VRHEDMAFAQRRELFFGSTGGNVVLFNMKTFGIVQ